MTYNPNAIARYFLYKYGDQGITPMKLIKMVYIAHGWYLAMNDTTLIDQNPEAWKYGPVIPALYQEYKMFGNKPITIKPSMSELNNPDVEAFLDRIWEVYGKYDALQLSAMTHKDGTPWTKTWTSLKNGDRSSLQIHDNDIKEYYRAKLDRNRARTTV